MVQRVTIAMVLLVFANGLIAQPQSYSFEQLDSLQGVEQRPVVVFLHADWCTICQAMQSTTWQDERVVKLLNTHFYFVPFDSECEDSVNFRGHTFAYRATGVGIGIHELAQALGTVEGRVSFPTTCLLNPDYAVVFRHNAFMGADEMRAVLEEAR